ncbi:recombination regulator RecX [Loigolactobacillus coryniformis]|uniref:recombination regulator RecX n=1 Tax=Loigolactobacillus coryniformis TaxID=1610 RepID=UPI002340FB30|nr:recombination regulator RecX [Loigolactobacillus coryniformis]MDC4186566.1 recombination regulator RecX [Loigolactobacillus coryniformis]
MPTITKITTQKRKGRYNIYLDEEYAFPVSESVLIKFRLAKGMEVPAELRAEIDTAEAHAQAYQLALNYLSYQLRTEMEVRIYLKQHDIPVAVRQQVIQRLYELNLLDDAGYAASYVRTAMRTSDKGPQVIRTKLREKGVKPELIINALDLFTTNDLLANGLKLAEKLAKRYRQQSFQNRQQKIRLGLRQKGFDADVTNQIISQLELVRDDDTEWAALVKQGEKVWRKTARYSGYERKQKAKQQLYRKGFALDQIDHFLTEKQAETE